MCQVQAALPSGMKKRGQKIDDYPIIEKLFALGV